MHNTSLRVLKPTPVIWSLSRLLILCTTAMITRDVSATPGSWMKVTALWEKVATKTNFHPPMMAKVLIRRESKIGMPRTREIANHLLISHPMSRLKNLTPNLCQRRSLRCKRSQTRAKRQVSLQRLRRILRRARTSLRTFNLQSPTRKKPRKLRFTSLTRPKEWLPRSPARMHPSQAVRLKLLSRLPPWHSLPPSCSTEKRVKFN